MVSVSHNASRWLSEMRARTGLVQSNLHTAIKRATLYYSGVSRRYMKQLIYDKPIPRRPRSGKPYWRRTGNLRRSERTGMASPLVGYVRNTAVYARHRHNLDYSRVRRAPGGNRTAHWRTDAMTEARPHIRSLLRAAVRAALQGRRL